MTQDAFIRIVPADEADWHYERRKRIQASDAAAVDGSSPWRTAAELYDEKTGMHTPEDISSKPYIRYGKEMEPIAREAFMLDFPYFSLSYNRYDILASKERPWMGATLDGELRVTVSPNPWGFPVGTRGVYEGKTGSWVKKANLYAWDGTESYIPAYYYSQCLHQLSVTGWDFVIVSARLKREAFKDTDMGCPEIVQFYRIIDRRAAAVREDMRTLEEAEESFWKDNVLAHKRPPRRIAI